MTASQETASCLESARRMWSIRPMNPAKWSLLCRRENSGVTIREANTLAKVFSFRGYEGVDDRENYGEHDIKIVNIDEAGSIDYIVYGYMNRGIHEGTVGIAVYHYDSLANTNEEQVFIPSSQSYEVMKSELGQLMYVTESGAFYIMVDGNVYGIDLNSLDTKVLVEGLSDEAVAISESNRFLAWVDPSAVRGSDTIHMIDFSTEKVTDVTGSASDYVKPLGFMQEDFVYGVAKSADVVVDAAGNTLFPMYQVKIMDTSSEEHEVLKTYEKPGYYVQKHCHQWLHHILKPYSEQWNGLCGCRSGHDHEP